MASHIYQDNLKSERLVTRKLTKNDVVAWSGFFSDKEAVEYFPNPCFCSDRELAERWIDKQLNRYANNKFGLQALIDNRTNEFIGQCGLLVQEVDGITELEVGYHIFKKYWGQGYAPEAARLFISYAFKNNMAPSVISIIDVRNIKSQRVADKNGLVLEKQTNWSDRNVYIYRMQRENWIDEEKNKK